MHVGVTYQETMQRGLAGASCHWLNGYDINCIAALRLQGHVKKM